jgi:hypothetical protein
MRQINPNLTSRESIGHWLQHQVDLMLEEMVADDAETMDAEELHVMLHKTAGKEYACGRTESRQHLLERDMTPEHLYSLIAEEIDDIYANG